MATRARPGATLAALLAGALNGGGCALPQSVGELYERRDGACDVCDAGADADALADADASGDESAPVDADALVGADADAGALARPSERALRGLETSEPGAVVLNWDAVAPVDFFRVYYVTRSGRVRLERRRASDHGVACATELAPPPDRTIAGNLAVAATHDVVIVPATPDGSGVRELWVTELVRTTDAAECAFEFSPWTLLPSPPDRVRFGSAPSATEVPHDPNAYVAVSDAARLRVHYLFRRPGAAWSALPWYGTPPTPGGLRIVSQPVLSHYAELLELWVLTENAAGERGLAFISRSTVWSSWGTLVLPAGEPPAMPPAVAESFDRSAGAVRWVAYVAESGRAYASQCINDDVGFRPWIPLGYVVPPLDPDARRAVPSAPSMGFRRRWREFDRDLMIVDSVWNGATRGLVHTDMDPTTGAWPMPTGSWPAADPLR